MKITDDIHFTYGFLKKTLRTVVYHKKLLSLKTLDEKKRVVLNSLVKDGFAIINNYWSEEKTNALLSKLVPYANKRINENFSSGAYLRVSKNDNLDDGGVVRMFHAEKEVFALKEFRQDSFINSCINLYYGFPMYSNYMTYQKNFLSEKQTRGYHVDGWTDEIKAFLYLEDVDVENGPFSFIKGSHKHYMTQYLNLIKDKGRNPDTKLSDEYVYKNKKNESLAFGLAGTLIIADVRGAHRGFPQLTKTRSIIYNNYFPKRGDIFPAY